MIMVIWTGSFRNCPSMKEKPGPEMADPLDRDPEETGIFILMPGVESV
jgi:hypothetical protein